MAFTHMLPMWWIRVWIFTLNYLFVTSCRPRSSQCLRVILRRSISSLHCPMAAAESPPLQFEDDFWECLAWIDLNNWSALFHTLSKNWIIFFALLRSDWILLPPSDPSWWERRRWERRPGDEVAPLPPNRERSRTPLREPMTPPGPPPQPPLI